LKNGELLRIIVEIVQKMVGMLN